MKKTISIFFFAVVFTGQLGYYFIYTIQQIILKERIEKELLAKVPDSSLELIIAEQYNDRIVWKEHGKEFTLDGVMYDVAKIKYVDGKTYLYCLNDKDEKQLLDGLVRAVKSTSDNNNHKPGGQNVKFQISDWLMNRTEMEFIPFTSITLHHIGFNVPLVTAEKEILAPPPKI